MGNLKHTFIFLCGDFAVICGDFSQIKSIKKINEHLIFKSFHQVAIPAYNEYRRSAKKNAYKADLTSLHKGWLAFGVELDSFCERDTTPSPVSISNVGMSSLVSSKLYGQRGICEDPNSTVSGCSPCAGQANQTACSAHNDGNLTPPSCGCTWNATVASNAPGKHNFIGFGAETCVVDNGGGDLVDLNNVVIQGSEGSILTTLQNTCDLNVTSYEMGVYGHVSGDNYYGVSITNNSVLGTEVEKSTSPETANAGCS